MAKTSKRERKAIAALEDAAAAAKFAKQVSKTLPGKHAEKLRAAADEAKGAADVSKKALRKHPKKVTRRADRAADAALVATESALEREQKKAARRAEKAAARQDAERRAAGKAARKKEGTTPSLKEDLSTTDPSPAAPATTGSEGPALDEMTDLAAPGELVEAVVEIEPADAPGPGPADAPGPGRGDSPDPEVADSPAPDRAGDSAFGPAADEAGQDEPSLALDTLTVAALRERAKSQGRAGYSRLTKAQLIDLLS
ncbi:hypothetical protein [Microbacterium sp. BK668]|uniref:hypothetical protein n=1 Tax=Microbacterium sp. BK668 TaxID=2512118 RepID=UPI00105D63AE|nr:hypothetical protein [Microbacterium sp. BK668]TDN92139.1 hypothetical protein EV279_1653 [Microbacterium sp. BK668]